MGIGMTGSGDGGKGKKGVPTPTDGELAILRVHWEEGPCTVRQVHERVTGRGAAGKGTGTGYTTTLKLMQIMTEKGLVSRDDSERTHVYFAAQPARMTQRAIVKELLEKAFAGSAADLVLQALSAKRATPEELAEIRKLLDEYQRGKG
jgi:predicted transcriptional regulator